MLLRICLIVAIIGGLAAGVLSFTHVQDIIIKTRADRDQYHAQYDSEHKTRMTAEANLKKTKADLDSTKKELATTKGQLDEANAKVADLDKKNAELTATLEKTTADRDTAQQELEQWHLIPGGLKPPQITGMIEELAKAKQARDTYIAENKVLNDKVVELNDRWKKYFGDSAPVILPAGLKGKVMAVDPKFDFVVLNIGKDQGVLERGEMMVNREGRLLGKIRIFSVQKDRCIANILPDWKRGEIMEGDEVID